MTHKSELIFQRLRGALDAPRNARKILITVRGTSVTRTDIAVLRVLLSEMNQRGIYITVDRPDRHVMEILERQNLAVHSEISFQEGPSSIRVLIATGIFSPAVFIDRLFFHLANPRRRPGLNKKLAEMRFLVLDNLSSLSAYNGPNGIAACFGKISQFLDAYPSIRFVAVAARDSLDAVRPWASGFFDLEVDIPDELFIE